MTNETFDAALLLREKIDTLKQHRTAVEKADVPNIIMTSTSNIKGDNIILFPLELPAVEIDNFKEWYYGKIGKALADLESHFKSL